MKVFWDACKRCELFLTRSEWAKGFGWEVAWATSIQEVKYTICLFCQNKNVALKKALFRVYRYSTKKKEKKMVYPIAIFFYSSAELGTNELEWKFIHWKIKRYLKWNSFKMRSRCRINNISVDTILNFEKHDFNIGIISKFISIFFPHFFYSFSTFYSFWISPFVLNLFRHFIFSPRM